MSLPSGYLSYYTVQHPEHFEDDWRVFYETNNRSTKRVRASFPHVLDVAYGQDSKQKLDLYLPHQCEQSSPVLLLLHGGGFVEGDRADYGFLAEPYVERGIVVAIASYRMTTEGFAFPDQLNDAKSAVRWLHDQVSRYGGNGKAIVVGGHSVGAILAAQLGVDRNWMLPMGLARDVVPAIICVSGRYLFPDDERDFIAYVPTPQQRELASPILHIVDPVPSIVVAVGSKESAYLEPSRKFCSDLEQSPIESELLVMDGYNHQDTLYSFCSTTSPLFLAILGVLRP